MKGVYPIAISCRFLQVSSSGYFRWRCNRGKATRLCSEELALAHIRTIHAQVKGEYGWPRMQKELQARGQRIGKERVRKLMASHGIRTKTKRKFIMTTDSKHSLPVAPDLVQRRYMPQAPNQLLCGDITYIATDEGWLYLAAVIDMSAVRWWDGACSPVCRAVWLKMPWQWLSGKDALSQGLSSTAIGKANTAARASKLR